jgi:hypothetical protein
MHDTANKQQREGHHEANQQGTAVIGVYTLGRITGLVS